MMTIHNVHPVRFVWLMSALLGGPLLGPQPLTAQIPDTFTNLQHFPEDITRDSLIGFMRQFSFSLGVRCQYCHAGGDGVSFEGVEFHSDEKPTKRKARYMLRMVDRINSELLANLPDRKQPEVQVECRTCHRGLSRPRMIDDIVAERIATEGVEAAVERYRQLRADNYGNWSYDFNEWTVNDLANEMAAGGNAEAGIALMEMNTEYYPESVSAWQILGDLRRDNGDRDGAVNSYRKALELAPGSQRLLKRLRDLGANPGF